MKSKEFVQFLSISLSNSSKVEFEISNNLVYKRTTMLYNSDGSDDFDIADIVFVNDDIRYELVLNRDPFEIRKKDKHNISKHNTERKIALWKEQNIDDFTIKFYRYKIQTNFFVVLFFLDIGQLEIPQILAKEFWFKNESELFLCYTSTDEDAHPWLYPNGVRFEKKDKISSDLEEFIECIKMQ